MVNIYYTYRPGSFATGGPLGSANVIVIHDIECPLTMDEDYAKDLTSPNYLGADQAHMGGIKSVHYVVGPFGICASTPEDTKAWHARGASGGSYSIEQTGYASLSRAEWLSPAGIQQLNYLADLIADIARRHGIPIKFLAGADLHAAYNDHSNKAAGGITTHQQLTIDGIGGNDHTDPGYPHGNYPMDYVFNRINGNSNTPTTVEKDWFDMATQADLVAAVQSVLTNGDVLDGIAIHVWLKGLRNGPARDDLLNAEDAIAALTNRVDVIFYQDGSGIWECNVTSGDSWLIPDPVTLENRKMVLTTAGHKWMDWPGGDVDIPSAFGRRNSTDISVPSERGNPPKAQ